MLIPGSYLINRYEIIMKIGSGGMADVYKAKDHVLNRLVAIKVSLRNSGWKPSPQQVYLIRTL